MMRITKEEFEKLYDPDVKKLEYDAIINKIDLRVQEILENIGFLNDEYNWWMYDNDDSEAENATGYFDPDSYKETIGINGYLSQKDSNVFELYGNGIPTKWLHEDFMDEFDAALKEYVDQKHLKKLNAISNKLKKLQEKNDKWLAIKSKLSNEEIIFIRNHIHTQYSKVFS